MTKLKADLMKNDDFYRSKMFASAHNISFDECLENFSQEGNASILIDSDIKYFMINDLIRFEHYLNGINLREICIDKWSSDICLFSEQLKTKKENILSLKFLFNNQVALFHTEYRWPNVDDFSLIDYNRIKETKGKNVAIIRNSLINSVGIIETFVFGWDTLILYLMDISSPITGDEILMKLNYPEKDFYLIRDKLINFLSKHLVYYNSLILK